MASAADVFAAALGLPAAGQQGRRRVDAAAFEQELGLVRAPSAVEFEQLLGLNLPKKAESGKQTPPPAEDTGTLSQTWNEHVALRANEAAGGDSQAKGRQWLLRPTLARCFRDLSADAYVRHSKFRGGLAVGMTSSRTSLTAAKMLAVEAMERAQTDGLRQVLSDVEAGPRRGSWLIHQRSMDAATLRVRLGHGQKNKMVKWVHGKINWLQDSLKIAALSPEKQLEFRTRLARLSRCIKTSLGSIPVMMQSGHVRWRTSAAPRSQSEILLPPLKAVEAESAEAVATVLESSVPLLNSETLQRLSPTVFAMVTVVNLDAAAYNAKATALYEQQAQKRLQQAGGAQNHIVLRHRCEVHQVARVCATSFLRLGLLSPLFSISRLMRQADFSCQWKGNMAEWVSSRLEIQHGHPPQDLRAINQTLLDLTLLRKAQWISARNHPALDGRDKGTRARRPTELASRFQEMWNGDFRLRQPQHYCCGCCSGRQESIEKMTGLLYEAMQVLQPVEAAANRWGSISESSCFFVFLNAIHNVGPQTLPGSNSENQNNSSHDTNRFGDDTPLAVITENDDFHAANTKRRHNAHLFHKDPNKQALLHTVSTLSIGPDAYCQALSALDHASGNLRGHESLASAAQSGERPKFLLSLVQGRDGPLHRVQQQLAQNFELGSPLLVGLDAIARREEGVAAQELLHRWVMEAFFIAATWAADFWLRCETVYDSYPFRLFASLDKSTAAEAEESLRPLWTTPDCCLNLATQRLKGLFTSAREMSSEQNQEFLLDIAKAMPLSTSNVERLHRQNISISQKIPQISLERLRVESSIRRWKNQYLLRGGKDNSILSTRHLKPGVLKPLKKRRRPASKGSGGQGSFPMFLNAMLPSLRRSGVGSYAECLKVCKSEWGLLAPEEKSIWKAKVQAKRASAAAKLPHTEEPPPPSQKLQTLWSAGGDSFPLTGERFADAIKRWHPTGGSGFFAAGDAVRKVDGENLIVERPAKADMIPVPKTCGEKHLGLCCSQDRAILPDCLAAARRLHAALTTPRSVVLLQRTDGSGRETSSYYILGAHRQSPKIQVFVLLEHAHGRLWPSQRLGGGFLCLTSYELVKGFFSNGATRISLRECNVTLASLDGPVLQVSSLNEELLLWPPPAAATKPKLESSGVVDCFGPPPIKRRFSTKRKPAGVAELAAFGTLSESDFEEEEEFFERRVSVLEGTVRNDDEAASSSSGPSKMKQKKKDVPHAQLEPPPLPPPLSPGSSPKAKMPGQTIESSTALNQAEEVALADAGQPEALPSPSTFGAASQALASPNPPTEEEVVVAASVPGWMTLSVKENGSVLDPGGKEVGKISRWRSGTPGEQISGKCRYHQNCGRVFSRAQKRALGADEADCERKVEEQLLQWLQLARDHTMDAARHKIVPKPMPADYIFTEL